MFYSSIFEISNEFDLWSNSSLFIDEIVRELFDAVLSLDFSSYFY